MRRFWLFPSFVLIATGCPSDDTSAEGEETGTESADDDDDGSGEESVTISTTVEPETSMGTVDESTTDTGVDSSTTMAGPVCGDGTVDEGEECDDSNMEDGDACTAMCTVPFEILWTATNDGSASNIDGAAGVVVDDAGNIYVVGTERNTGTGQDVWLQQYMADGTEGWTYNFNGTDMLDDTGASVAFDAMGNLAVVGSTESAMSGSDILVVIVDVADGTQIGDPIIVDGSGTGPDDIDDEDFGTDIALDPSGTLVAVGAVRVDAQSYDIWTAEIDPAAMMPVVWEQTLNGPDSGPDIARAVNVGADGTVTVLANQELPGNVSSGIVLVYGDDGTPDDAATVELDWFVSDFAFDMDGNVVVVGRDETGNSLLDIRTTLYDPTFTETWTSRHDGPAHGGDSGAGVALDPMNRVITVGSQSNTDEQNDGWIGTYNADGTAWWGDAHTSESGLDDFFNDVAVTPDGDYVVVGSESVIGQQRNAFVRKYHSL